MRNTMNDLNNHLFEQLERLNDEDLKGEALKEELERSKAITRIASEIINNGRLVVSAKRTMYEIHGNCDKDMPSMLKDKNE